MIVRKVIAGSALAAGLGVAGMFGAMGTATAAPGIGFGGNGVDVNIGADTKVTTSPGNYGVAWNGGKATAKNGTGNIVIAGAGSTANVTDNDENRDVEGNLVPSSRNLVAALGGGTADVQGSENRVLANGVGGTITGNGTNKTVASLCGGDSSISAQSDRVALTPCA